MMGGLHVLEHAGLRGFSGCLEIWNQLDLLWFQVESSCTWRSEKHLLSANSWSLNGCRAKSRTLAVGMCNRGGATVPGWIHLSKNNMYECHSFLFCFIWCISGSDCVWMRQQLILFVCDGLITEPSWREADWTTGGTKYPSLTRLMRQKAEWDEGIDFYLLRWSRKSPRGALEQKHTHSFSSFVLCCMWLLLLKVYNTT